ncbi:4Fe-4S binding protein, partial [bacterium]|nr:4Fe-4S binding protein [bacterium]
MRRTGIEGRAAAGVAEPRAGRGGRRRGARRRSEGRRTAVRAVALAVVAAGLVAGVGVGTFSGLGWGAVTLLCPLGALTTMLASRMLVPRAVVSLALGVALILLVGRAFCGWVCPVPLVGRLREAFEPRRRARPAGAAGGRAGGAVAGA